ncbi:MAG TPA: hypothetical protein VJ879_13290 [Desulfobacter sp.]|nr:hypothetical protein [Desulfobacter sp.]
MSPKDSQTQTAPAEKSGKGQKGQENMQPPQSKMLENRLNRLEDKPGMALIPQTGVRSNDKDW